MRESLDHPVAGDKVVCPGGGVLYVGIDVGKRAHVAAFVSTGLLSRHVDFGHCPTLAFENTRAGLDHLMTMMRGYAPLEYRFTLVEHTGHYHQALVDSLLEEGLVVYAVAPQQRRQGNAKTDKLDALALAYHLYRQLELAVPAAVRKETAHRVRPALQDAAQLKGLIGVHHELVHEITRYRNRLTALCDELFPEFTQVFRNPNSSAALKVRARYPTCEAVAAAALDALCAMHAANNARLRTTEEWLRLKALAGESIGVRASPRRDGLVFEQDQLIRRVGLLQEHLSEADTRIESIMHHSRQGRLLLSIPGIGMASGAAILAAIGDIDRFRSAAALRAYLGWAPRVAQSGTSMYRAHIMHSGERTMKEVMFLAALHCVRQSAEWGELYQRLIERKYRYDARTRTYKGKKVVLGRIAGQLVTVIYALLRQDAEVVASTPDGAELPAPHLYDPNLHRLHLSGGYPHGPQSEKVSSRGTVNGPEWDG